MILSRAPFLSKAVACAHGARDRGTVKRHVPSQRQYKFIAKATALLTAGRSDVLRRPETRKGLNSSLTQLARRDQTGKNAAPLSPQPQVAGAIPVPPAREP